MTERTSLIDLARGAMVPTLCIMLMGYFGYYALQGRTGLLAWGGYKAERAQLERRAAGVAARKAAIEQRVALLDPHHVDPDLADELVRHNLGVVRADEIVVQLPKAD